MIYEVGRVAADGRFSGSVRLADINGKTLGRFFYADTETGLLKGWAIDEKGKLKLTPWKQDPETMRVTREMVLDEIHGTLGFDVIDRNTDAIIYSYRPASV